MKTRTLSNALALLFCLLTAMPLMAQQAAHRVQGWRIYKTDTTCIELVSFPIGDPSTICVEDSLPGLTLRGAVCTGQHYLLIDSEDGLLPTRFMRYDVERRRTDTIRTYHITESEAGFIILDMAYDATEDKVYVLAFDISATTEEEGNNLDEPLRLYTLDPQTGKCTYISEENDIYLIAIDVDKNGQMYALAADGSVWDVDKHTFNIGEPVQTAPMKSPSSLQSIAFDHSDGLLYWCGFSETDMGFLGVFDMQGSGVTAYRDLGRVGEDSEIIGARIIDSPLARTAPAAPTDAVATALANGAERARLTWVMPTTDLDGNALTGELGVDIYRNDAHAVRLDCLSAGQTASWMDGAAQGMIEYRIVPRNSAGSGRAAYADSIFAGIDRPGMPAHISAAKEAGTDNIVLTWEAPETGMHNGWYDASQLSYSIRRQPDGTTMAEGLTECTLTDRTITEPHAYFYEITARTAAGEGPAGTSPVIAAGGSMALPYTCDFSTSEAVRYWTVNNADNDQHTWGVSRNYNDDRYSYMRYFSEDDLDPESAADDWLISPALSFEAGKHYRVSWQLRTLGVLYPVDYEVAVGTAPTPEAMNDYIYTRYHETNNGSFGFEDKQAIFTFPATAEGHVAFHMQNLSSAHITKVRVEEVLPIDLEVIDFKAPELENMEKAAEFSVTVRNNGYEEVAGYQVRLTDENGAMREYVPVREPLQPGDTYTVVIQWKPNRDGTYAVGAEVVANGDADSSNNKAEAVNVTFNKAAQWYDFTTGKTPTRTSPFFLEEPFGFSQTIYTKENIGAQAGYISAIKYYYSSAIVTTVNPFDVTLYLANTNDVDFDDSAPRAQAMEDFTQVFQGKVSVTESSGSVTILFDKPFKYEGGSLNVMVFTESDNSGQYLNWWCYYKSTEEVMHTIYYGGTHKFNFIDALTTSIEMPNASFYCSEATGIEAPSNAGKADAPLYDLQGRRLQTPPARGLYLQGERKILKP
ncbi:MAG: choice-of-anchor J domain-containing protein [Alloprevotella sp.]|nr:choice-of-anchor J domain-containing protein [Alloprevotella sp.]